MIPCFDDLPTPLGTARAVVRGDAVLALGFAEGWARVAATLEPRLAAAPRRDARALAVVRDALERYFAGELGALAPLRIEPGGTPFQRAVWRALCEVPPGRTIGYAALARAVGIPRAARAVGAACGANPAWLAIPCHRALGNDGQLRGYAGGIARKRWLLAHEGALPVLAGAGAEPGLPALCGTGAEPGLPVLAGTGAQPGLPARR